MNAILPLLESQLQESPENIDLLKRLSEIYRQQGRLSKAKLLQKKLLMLAPESLYAKVVNNQVLSLQSEDWHSDLFWPAPYVHEENVLSKNEHEEFLAWCHSKKTSFKPAKIFKSDSVITDEKFRNQLIYNCSKLEKSQMLSKFQPVITSVMSQLGISHNRLKAVNTQVSLTQLNGFGKTHSDGVVKPTETPLTEFSLLYYLATDPLSFHGGDLRLHDTNFKLGTYNIASTKIPFASNSLVFFPRYFFHEITQVSSELPLAWNDGRFAILFKLLIEEC